MDGEISGPELEAKLENGDSPLIIDIRNKRQFDQHRIPGAVNVPLAQLPQRVETVRDAEHVVTVCPHGKASVKAARLVTSFEGFSGTVESLSCGFSGWDGPVEGRDIASEQSQDAPF